jgi:4,5-DOPA dioxygenase extradiol
VAHLRRRGATAARHSGDLCADHGYDWAQRFDEDAKAVVLESPTEVATLDAHRDYATAVPTPDHFIPLLYLAGLADAAGGGTEVLVDGYAYGSLSMTAYTVGMTCAADSGLPGASTLSSEGPADCSNI